MSILVPILDPYLTRSGTMLDVSLVMLDLVMLDLALASRLVNMDLRSEKLLMSPFEGIIDQTSR